VDNLTSPEEATVPMPVHPVPKPARRRRSDGDLTDLVEDLGFSLMLFAGAALVVTILVLILLV
jgi:hypothetical protein